MGSNKFPNRSIFIPGLLSIDISDKIWVNGISNIGLNE